MKIRLAVACMLSLSMGQAMGATMTVRVQPRVVTSTPIWVKAPSTVSIAHSIAHASNPNKQEFKPETPKPPFYPNPRFVPQLAHKPIIDPNYHGPLLPNADQKRLNAERERQLAQLWHKLDKPTTCLAAVAYHEARGETRKGQKAVLLVTLNRTKPHNIFPDDVCKVVKQRSQYEWVALKGDKDGLYPIKDLKAWEESIRLAHSLLKRAQDPDYEKLDFTRGATYFNHIQRGRKYQTQVASSVIGQHIFY